MVSFLPGPAAARAVRVTKPGTLSPQAARPEAAKDVLRKSRRLADMFSPRKSIQLELRQRQHEVAQGADALVGGVLGGPVDRRLLFGRLLLVGQQAVARFGGDVPLQEEAQEEIDALRGGVL